MASEPISLPDLVYLKAWAVACNAANPKSANWLASMINARSEAHARYQRALDACMRDAGLKQS